MSKFSIFSENPFRHFFLFFLSLKSSEQFLNLRFYLRLSVKNTKFVKEWWNVKKILWKNDEMLKNLWRKWNLWKMKCWKVKCLSFSRKVKKYNSLKIFLVLVVLLRETWLFTFYFLITIVSTCLRLFFCLWIYKNITRGWLQLALSLQN